MSGLTLLLWLLIAALTPAQAQGPGTAAQDQPTQERQNREILIELRAIRQLLERLAGAEPPQPKPVRIAELKGFVLGRQDAPLTMVEYTDLQCPYCREYALAVFDQIKKNWIDTGKLRYVSRDLPMEMLHPQAKMAARASRCSGDLLGGQWKTGH